MQSSTSGAVLGSGGVVGCHTRQVRHLRHFTFIEMSSFFERRSIPRKHIQQIQRYWRRPTAGLQIDHDVTDQPTFIVFWPSDIDELEKVLDANAFPVATLSV